MYMQIFMQIYQGPNGIYRVTLNIVSIYAYDIRFTRAGID